ncbi:MAG: alpha/beta fold hydrolase [Sandaracinaceae bacterium]
MKTTTITVGRWQVEAARAPRPGAPKLILTAPWPLTLHTFERIWPRLISRFDVTAVDLPGFGGSAQAPETMTPSAMADFLEALLEEVAPEGAHLVATDVGVPAALVYAARRPAGLRSLTLSDGPGTAAPVLQPGLERMVKSPFVRWLLSLSPRTFVRIAARDGYQHSNIAADALDHAVRSHGREGRLRKTLGFLGSYPEELPALDAKLGSVEVPTLLLWGERDVFVPPENAERIAARLGDVRVVRLPEAGHFSHDDDVEGYADNLLSFVESAGLGDEAIRPADALPRRPRE